MKLAEGLLLRKQLQEKVAQLTPLRNVGINGVFEERVQRVKVSDDIDQITITTPRIALADITRTYDHYAGELRKIDAAIQQANWTHDLEYSEAKPPVDEDVNIKKKETK